MRNNYSYFFPSCYFPSKTKKAALGIFSPLCTCYVNDFLSKLLFTYFSQAKMVLSEYKEREYGAASIYRFPGAHCAGLWERKSLFQSKPSDIRVRQQIVFGNRSERVKESLLFSTPRRRFSISAASQRDKNTGFGELLAIAHDACALVSLVKFKQCTHVQGDTMFIGQ